MTIFGKKFDFQFLAKKFDFLQNFRLLAKSSIFCRIFDFRQNFRFLPKNFKILQKSWIFGKNFHVLANSSIFGKIFDFSQVSIFGQKFQFQILVEFENSIGLINYLQ